MRATHGANDRAVLAAYGLKPDTSEPEIVARLFGLYAKMVKKGGRHEMAEKRLSEYEEMLI